MNPLTPRQKQCLDFIRSYSEANDIMPSLRDILVGIGCSSTSHAAYLVRKIAEAGYIRRAPGKARSMEFVTPETMQAVLLSKEVFRLVQAYAAGQKISVDVAVSEIVREAMGAA